MLQLSENVPLAPHTSLGVGGNARYFLDALDEHDLAEGLNFAETRGCPTFILGRGSNLVISDAGFDGLVIRMRLRGIRDQTISKTALISVAAGEEWDAFVQYAVERNLGGVEALSGIPGSVGATPIQNVGAYGQEVSEAVETVKVLDRKTMICRHLTCAECGFSYRESIFNGSELNRYIILEVSFRLLQDAAPCLRYEDIRRRLSERDRPTLLDVRKAVLEIRGEKAMLLKEGDPDCRSAGSFFKNPVLDAASIAAIEEAARTKGSLTWGESIPCHKTASGDIKIPAAWLIERAGFFKGYTRGQVAISSRHSLALTNRGNATAVEIINLMREIQSGVFAIFKIRLRPEPVFVGFEQEKFE